MDEFGELSRQIESFQPVIRRQKALSDEITSWYQDLAPDQSALVEGHLYAIHISERAFERSIPSLRKVYKSIGLKLDEFLKLCTLPLKHLDSFIDPSQQGDLVDRQRTGRRSVKAVAKAPLSA